MTKETGCRVQVITKRVSTDCLCRIVAVLTVLLVVYSDGGCGKKDCNFTGL